MQRYINLQRYLCETLLNTKMHMPRVKAVLSKAMNEQGDVIIERSWKCLQSDHLEEKVFLDHKEPSVENTEKLHFCNRAKLS